MECITKLLLKNVVKREIQYFGNYGEMLTALREDGESVAYQFVSA
jgi:hypothetical protein